MPSSGPFHIPSFSCLPISLFHSTFKAQEVTVEDAGTECGAQSALPSFLPRGPSFSLQHSLELLSPGPSCPQGIVIPQLILGSALDEMAKTQAVTCSQAHTAYSTRPALWLYLPGFILQDAHFLSGLPRCVAFAMFEAPFGSQPLSISSSLLWKYRNT